LPPYFFTSGIRMNNFIAAALAVENEVECFWAGLLVPLSREDHASGPLPVKFLTSYP
jgi:hypothetical protein